VGLLAETSINEFPEVALVTPSKTTQDLMVVLPIPYVLWKGK